MITLYTNDCPRCKVLKMKLDQKNIPYETVSDITAMRNMGIMSVPMLKVENELLEFTKSVEWVNNK